MDVRHTSVFLTAQAELLDCHVVVHCLMWMLLLVVAVELVEMTVVLAADVVLAAADRKMKRDEISVQILGYVTC